MICFLIDRKVEKEIKIFLMSSSPLSFCWGLARVVFSTSFRCETMADEHRESAEIGKVLFSS